MPAPACQPLGFNPRPSCEGRPGWHFAGEQGGLVSIRAPRVRGDDPLYLIYDLDVVSIRAPRVRGDAAVRWDRPHDRCFNPRPSCEGRRMRAASVLASLMFQSAPLV